MVLALQRRLQTREQRKKLDPQPEPYFVEVRRGLAIGYRRKREGGSWLLREYRNGGYAKRRLGAADDVVPADGATVLSWQDALSMALTDERPTVTKPGRYTVDEAAGAYFEQRAKRGGGVGHDQSTYNTFMKPEFGSKAVGDLTTAELARWHASHVPETSDREKRRKAQATANRRWNVLRAILNDAFQKSGKVSSDAAWRRVKPYRNVDRPRERFLSTVEAKRLLNALPADARALARGALYTGCRMGELLALRVADVVDGRVHVRHSKSGKARAIPLSKDGLKFFDSVTAGKLGDAVVFARADGEPWYPVGIARAMREGCKVTKIVPAATFHDLRRSYGSLLLNSGAAAEVVQELLGHADLRMTRRAYAHLLDATVAKAVKKHLPSFGLEKGNVRALKTRDTAK